MTESVVVLKRWSIEVPADLDQEWVFVFVVKFVWTETQGVVVYWIEESIGSGSFEVEDISVTWFTLLKAYHVFSGIAQHYAKLWAEEKESV